MAPAAVAILAPGIIDTNVNLFDWPFRALKYRDTKALVAKLKKHRIIEAWAGSFEALLSKDMNGVNARLAAECRQHGPGFLIPFGSVNLAWPDWEEDVRRCHEVHKMPGLRIYPGYQPFDLDHPGMESLVKMTAERGLILQVVFGMEDPRVHHPIINVGPVTFASVAEGGEEVRRTRKLSCCISPARAGRRALSQFMAQDQHVHGYFATGRQWRGRSNDRFDRRIALGARAGRTNRLRFPCPLLPVGNRHLEIDRVATRRPTTSGHHAG